ncbi:MAG: SRPBCC family protein [Blastocatellia bacterium]
MIREFEHSIEVQVNRDFAWRFWTNVANWAFDPSVESVELDGPFAAGAKGVTNPRGPAPVEWRLVEVQDRSGAIIEIALPGATARFHWRYEDAAGGGARITQRVTLEGERADDYAEGMAMLENGIPQGMRKMAEVMARAAAEQA